MALSITGPWRWWIIEVSLRPICIRVLSGDINTRSVGRQWHSATQRVKNGITLMGIAGKRLQWSRFGTTKRTLLGNVSFWQFCFFQRNPRREASTQIGNGKLTHHNLTVCPHAAFEHPGSPPNALPRESVEVRCFAIWSEGEGRTTA